VLGVVNVADPLLADHLGRAVHELGHRCVGNGLVPLFAIVLAYVGACRRPITLNRLAGLMIGFVGAVLLASPSLGSDRWRIDGVCR